MFHQTGTTSQFSKASDECQSKGGEMEARDWAKGAGLAPSNSREFSNHLSLFCLTALLIQSSEYNTFIPLPLAPALLLQGKLNINLSIFVSTQQQADTILNCEKICLWNS